MKNVNTNTSLKILEDGINDWVTKKMSNEELEKSFKRLAIKNGNELLFNKFANIAENLYYCGSYLEFKRLEDGTKKLNKASFCRVRLCPMCTWRRSKKVFGQVSKIIENEEMKKYDYVFTTLTCKNVTRLELRSKIDTMLKSFNRMVSDNSKIKKMCKGYFRALEVTYKKIDRTYHPHIHVIFAVEKNYFSWRNKDYIKTDELALIWKKYLGVDYVPVVDMRKVKTETLSSTQNKKAISEVAKYTVKEKDIIIKRNNGKVNEELTDINVETLYFALYKKRLVGFGGIMKELHKKLNLEDLNDDKIDLVNTDNEENYEIVNNIILKYKWNVGFKNYVLSKE